MVFGRPLCACFRRQGSEGPENQWAVWREVRWDYRPKPVPRSFWADFVDIRPTFRPARTLMAIVR